MSSATSVSSSSSSLTEPEPTILSLPTLGDDSPELSTESKSAAAAAAATASGSTATLSSSATAESDRDPALLQSQHFRKATLTDSLPTRFLFVANCGAARGDTEDQMRSAFSRYGRLQTIVMPKHKPFCIIAFSSPIEAERAMKWPTATQLGNRIIKMNFAALRQPMPSQIGAHHSGRCESRNRR